MAQIKRDEDRFARDSFSMRGMTRWQLWGITAAAVIVVLLLLAYAL